MSGVAAGHGTVVGLGIPVRLTDIVDGEERKAGTHQRGNGAVEGKLDVSVLSGRFEARDSVCDDAETMRRWEAGKRSVYCPCGIQDTLAGKVPDSARECQMNGEGLEDVTGYVLDVKETVESTTMMTKFGSEDRYGGKLKELVEEKEEGPNDVLEGANSIDKYRATPAAPESSIGNIPEYQSELDSQRGLLESIPGHRENDINHSQFSMSGKQIYSNFFLDEHIETLEKLEATKHKMLALKGASFSSASLSETEDKECPCDGSSIPFENVSTSHETKDTPKVELNTSILTNFGTNKKCLNNYTIEELLALRFIDVEEQHETWTYIYSHLGPVARELDEISASEQPRKNRKNVDRRQRRKKLKDAVSELPTSEVSHTNSRLSAHPAGESVTATVQKDHKYIGPGTSDYVLSVNADAENVEKDHEGVGTPDDVLSVNADVHSAVEIECEEYENSDDEYDSIQRPAFFVEGEPDFESGPPQDGLEYLRRVRWEAMQIPNVKKAKLDKSKLEVEQTPYMPSIPEIADCPNNFVPSQHWVEMFLTDFLELKKALSQMGGSDIKISSPRKLFDKQGGEFRLASKVPLLSLILDLDAISRAAVLRKHVQVLESSQALSRLDLEWAFALLAVLDEPVTAETAASIRCLLRKCANLRASKIEYDDDVIMMNIIITIAGKYFGQSEK